MTTKMNMIQVNKNQDSMDSIPALPNISAFKMKAALVPKRMESKLNIPVMNLKNSCSPGLNCVQNHRSNPLARKGNNTKIQELMLAPSEGPTNNAVSDPSHS